MNKVSYNIIVKDRKGYDYKCFGKITTDLLDKNKKI